MMLRLLLGVFLLFGAPAFAQDVPSELRGRWIAEDISGGGVVDRVQTAIDFEEGGTIAGSGGCNRIFGKARIDGTSIVLSGMGATRMACPPAVMDQEQKFLSALSRIASWKIDDHGKLNLLDGTGSPLIRLAKADRGARIEIDLPGSVEMRRTRAVYDCGSLKIDAEYIDAGAVSLATLNLNGDFVVASNVLSASGARYAAGPYVWWTKGDEASLQDIRQGEAAAGTTCRAVRP